MNDYERIAQVIRFLDAHFLAQPDLDELAQRAGLSSSHFHRLFSKWAGVTPKDFVQCLTAAHAKKLLRSGGSALDAAVESGLSGPGRLHDLCVSLEAASPGEIKSGGEGWQIHAGFTSTLFGKALIAQASRGICHLSFVEPDEEAKHWAALSREWSNAQIVRDDNAARSVAGQIFRDDPAPRPETLRALVKGSEFQVRVWRALLQIPSGRLTTYGTIATAIGQPEAARAVGSAVGQNAIAFLIPCHRVIRSTGLIGEYRWGSIRKKAMVGWESTRSIIG